MTPTQRKDLKFWLVAIAVLVFLYLVLALFAKLSPEALEKFAAGPIPFPTATSTPVPDPLSWDIVKSRYDSLSTDLQKRQYLDSLVGKRVHWRGVVNNVDGEGNVYVAIGNVALWLASGDVIEVQGVPLDRAAKFSSGDPIDFQATIRSADIFLGVQFGLKIISLNESPAQ